MFDRDVLRTLATADPGPPVLSVYARTDPRDPVNTHHSPAWEIELRNGLSAVTDRLEAGDDRDLRLTFRTLRERVEDELINLDPAQRARSVAWFLTADGSDSRRLSLQLPVRADTVVWDGKPFVSPLVDVADRGAATGVVLVGLEHVRLMHIEQGEASEPEDSGYDISTGDWRPFAGAGGGSPTAGMRPTAHKARHEARIEKRRGRHFRAAAADTAKRLDELGWESVALVAEHQVAVEFREELTPDFAARVAVELDLNLGHEDATTVADALEPHLEASWLQDTLALSEDAHQRAGARGAGSLGPQETLGALVQGRVAHLLLDPAHDFAPAAAGPILEQLAGPPELLGERAVEAAIASGAEVTALPADQCPRLAEAGGMLAVLRY